MPKRRKLLKSCVAGTSLLAYPGLVAAAEKNRSVGVARETRPNRGLGDCTAEILAENEEYRDIYASCGEESVEVRYYKESGEIVFISTPDESNRVKGRDVESQFIPLPDPPDIVGSWETRQEVVGNCDVSGISDHLFVGADIELTQSGTNLSAALLAAIICALPTFNPIISVACGIGAAVFSWLFLEGYGVEGEGTVGVMDVDEGKSIYTERFGWVYVDVPSVAVVGLPWAGASTDELEYFELISDFANYDLPQVEPVHLEPLLDQL